MIKEVIIAHFEITLEPLLTVPMYVDALFVIFYIYENREIPQPVFIYFLFCSTTLAPKITSHR